MKFFLVAALLAGQCAPSSTKNPDGTDPRDVTGNYDVTYDNQLTLKLNVGGADRVVTANGYGGIADFGTYQGQPLQLDLTQFCARPDVKCPSEAFWSKVAIDQPNLGADDFDLQTVTVIDNTTHDLDAGQRAASISGLVDHNNQDNFLLGLGAQAGGSGDCAAFDVSWANGRFSRVGESMKTVTVYRDEHGKACDPDAGTPSPNAGEGSDAGTLSDGGVVMPDVCSAVQVQELVIPAGAKVNGIASGSVGLFWAGGCAFGPVLVGATFSLETGYTAKRTGDYDPPPFIPSAVVLPDGGVDGGFDSSVDGGP